MSEISRLIDLIVVRVLIGGQEAVVHYKGRSAEFPGIDQLQFQVPAGVSGCFVPVTVIVNGMISNFGTMAIDSGSSCADPVSFTTADLAPTALDGDTSMGAISLLGIDFTGPGVPEGAGRSNASAGFASVTSLSMMTSLGPLGFLGIPPASMGSCYVYQGPGEDMELDDRVAVQGLNAGSAMSLTAPFGVYDLNHEGSAFAIEDPAHNLLTPGMYTFDNGAGGSDVGSFHASISIPASQFTWTNRNAIQNVVRGQDLTVTWTGGNASQEIALVLGYSARKDRGVVASFLCAGPIGAGQFTVPGWVLAALPATGSEVQNPANPASILGVGRMSRLDQNRSTAPGLDAAYMLYILINASIVPYE